MTQPGRLLGAALVVFVAALGSGAVGFVYAHEPVRDEVQVVLDRRRPADAPTVVGGVVTRSGDGRITIEGEAGTVEVTVPAGVSTEDLERIAAGDLAVGAQVNVGAERSDYGVAITGIVVVAGR